MISTHLSRLAYAVCAFAYLTIAAGVPLSPAASDVLDHRARGILARATPVAPHFVIYSDKYVSGATGPPDVSQVTGYNVFALSFLLIEGAYDQAEEWTELTATERSTVKAQYEAAGISLIVSLFGSTDAPTSTGADPITTANTMAAWVLEYELDGVDVDYEDFNAMDAENGSAEAWLGNFTQQLRVNLPQGSYILTHAPVAPWFSPGIYASGAYLTVDKTVGSLIDWYNIQFYNQGTTEYTTCSGLLTNSSSTWPNSSLFQIAASGVSLDKLVIGKPATTSDANNGYIDPSTLATCVEQAASQGWDAGVMVWEYPDAAAPWISTVRSLAFPESSTAASSTSATATSSSTTTTSSATPTSTGSCAGVTAWSSSVAYTGGEQVTYNGDLWTAQWWTEDDTPGGTAGVWTEVGACSSSALQNARVAATIGRAASSPRATANSSH